jgi:hypothetical protein
VSSDSISSFALRARGGSTAGAGAAHTRPGPKPRRPNTGFPTLQEGVAEVDSSEDDSTEGDLEEVNGDEEEGTADNEEGQEEGETDALEDESAGPSSGQ